VDSEVDELDELLELSRITGTNGSLGLRCARAPARAREADVAALGSAWLELAAAVGAAVVAAAEELLDELDRFRRCGTS
jgi:hypothetical protein